MTLREYLAQIEAWEKIYGKPPVPRNADPTLVRASCDRCGKIRKRMSRHHISNDFMFAVLRPDLYAKRYIAFTPEDVRRLCNRCHRAIHVAYNHVLAAFTDEMKRQHARERDPNKEFYDQWRTRFRLAYEDWRSVTKREVKGGPRKDTQRGRNNVRNASVEKRHDGKNRDHDCPDAWPPG